MNDADSWTLSQERAEQRRRRTVGIVVVLGVGALMAFAFWKFQLNDSSVEVLTSEGAAHMERALTGDFGSWVEARGAFRRAAGRNPFDPYPVFCMAAVGWFEQLQLNARARPPAPEAALVWPMARQVALKQDYAGAREALIGLSARAGPRDQARVDYFIRLVTALEVAARKRREELP